MKEFEKKLRWIGVICSLLASFLTAWRTSWEWAVVVFSVMIIVFISLYIVTVLREMREIKYLLAVYGYDAILNVV